MGWGGNFYENSHLAEPFPVGCSDNPSCLLFCLGEKGLFRDYYYYYYTALSIVWYALLGSRQEPGSGQWPSLFPPNNSYIFILIFYSHFSENPELRATCLEEGQKRPLLPFAITI